MIKKLIEEIKEKGTTTRDKKAKLNKLYPREYCFFGGCNRKVSEDGINYECYHREIFLADDDIAPTTFKCLSKDIDSESVIEIKAVKSGTLEYTYTILDNGEEYNVSICSANSLSEPNKKLISRKEIIRMNDKWNRKNEEYCKDLEGKSQKISSEFEK